MLAGPIVVTKIAWQFLLSNLKIHLWVNFEDLQQRGPLRSTRREDPQRKRALKLCSRPTSRLALFARPLTLPHSFPTAGRRSRGCSRALPSAGRLRLLLAGPGNTRPGVSLSPPRVSAECKNMLHAKQRLTARRLLPVSDGRGERHQARRTRDSRPRCIRRPCRTCRNQIRDSPGSGGGSGSIRIQGESEIWAYKSCGVMY